VKTSEDVAPNFGENKPGCFTMTTPVSKFRPHTAVSGEVQNGCHPHQLHSPDLAPCDFFIFPKMKLKRKERLFDTIEEIQAEWQKVLDTLAEKNFQEDFRKWRRRWDRCLHAGGNNFEGDGSR
jgi:hypothetical protein